jgi:hypothetical protein
MTDQKKLMLANIMKVTLQIFLKGLNNLNK